MTTLYVDTDVSGGDSSGSSLANAYASMSAAVAAVPNPMTDDYTVLCHATAGSADTAIVETDIDPSSYTLTLKASDDDRAVKTGIDASKYRLAPASGNGITIMMESIVIDGLQIVMTGESAIRDNYRVGAGSDIRITNCYLDGPPTDQNGRGMNLTDAQSNVTVQNTIVRNFDYGVYVGSAVVELHQCVIEGSTYAGVFGGTSYNCAVFNCVNDFDTATADYCATDDGNETGVTNSVAPSGSDWTNEFSDPANGDFTLLNTGNLYQGGTTITGGPSTDIEGDSWGATPSIGADEYVSAGGGGSAVPNIMQAQGAYL